MPMQDASKTGVYLIGGLGEIAISVVVGARAIARQLAPPLGLVSARPPFDALDLSPLDGLVFGGLDIRPGSLADSARTIGENSQTFSARLLDTLAADLQAMQPDLTCDGDLDWIVHAPAGGSPPLGALLSRVRGYIRQFAQRHRLRRVVLVDLSSAEATPALTPAHHNLTGFTELITGDRKDQVTPSMLYAYAACMESCGYVNFTPNTGAAIGALGELAERQGVPYAGNDGKTGETLLKTVVAPMFAARNLQVLSWEGINMLGNADGRTLNRPECRSGKLANKHEVLAPILGYPVHSEVNISYVPSLGDWKTAWDFVHFQGFLGVKMALQFTWQGCDSILAAPLVLDLIRFTELAMRRGETGPMKHLASFFKKPLAVDEMDFFRQFALLHAYAARHGQSAARPAGQPG